MESSEGNPSIVPKQFTGLSRFHRGQVQFHHLLGLLHSYDSVLQTLVGKNNIDAIKSHMNSFSCEKCISSIIKPNPNGRTTLHYVQNLRVMKYLLSYIPLNVYYNVMCLADVDGNTILHQYATIEYQDILQTCLDKLIECDCIASDLLLMTNRNGDTVLHLLASNHMTDPFSVCLAILPDPDERLNALKKTNNQGDSVFHIITDSDDSRTFNAVLKVTRLHTVFEYLSQSTRPGFSAYGGVPFLNILIRPQKRELLSVLLEIAFWHKTGIISYLYGIVYHSVPSYHVVRSAAATVRILTITFRKDVNLFLLCHPACREQVLSF